MIDQNHRQSAKHSFGPLPVSPTIAHSLEAMGYHDPTPVQEKAIPALREGQDVLAQAQTGTGKTAAFGIPLIERIAPEELGVQAIVLVPTRELCLQVAEELKRLASNSRLRPVPVYGGVGLARQINALRQGAQVVVGTPGRIEDLIKRGHLNLRAVRLVVLDEADRMLDVGFLPPIERILERTPSSRQTALFSATIADDVRHLARRHMRQPVSIEIDPEKPTVEEIDQRFERVRDGNKIEALKAHLDDGSCYLALVFRRTTHKVDRLTRDLSRAGYKVGALHGRRSQNQRERVLGDLRQGKLQALVATDIAARGLDIANLTHVFNFDLPDTPETYVHRIGRTGRAGETGIAITLIDRQDEDALRQLEKYLASRSADRRAITHAPQRSAGRNRNGYGTRDSRGRSPVAHMPTEQRVSGRPRSQSDQQRHVRRFRRSGQTGPDRGRVSSNGRPSVSPRRGG